VSISIDPASLRLLERSEARAYRIERGGAMNAIVDVIDDALASYPRVPNRTIGTLKVRPND
jgi:hypothetical protein